MDGEVRWLVRRTSVWQTRRCHEQRVWRVRRRGGVTNSNVANVNVLHRKTENVHYSAQRRQNEAVEHK